MNTTTSTESVDPVELTTRKILQLFAKRETAELRERIAFSASLIIRSHAYHVSDAGAKLSPTGLTKASKEIARMFREYLNQIIYADE